MNRNIKIYCFFLACLCCIPNLVLAKDWIYTTRPGDNLWNISKTYLTSANDWKKLREYNRVNIPKRLSPGIRLRIPVAWLKHQPESVTIVYTRGSVEVVRSDGNREPVQKDDQLLIGDKIISNEKAAATLRFADGSIILLEAESELVLDSLSAFKSTGMVDTQLRLQRGGLETQVTPLSKPNSRFEIITPAAVAAVRGTRYRVGVDTINNLMRTEVLEGKVNVATTKAGQSLDKGYGSLAEKDKRPLPPRKLLLETDLSSVPKLVRKLPVEVTWPVLAGAMAYRIQVTTADKDESIISDAKVKEAKASLAELADGHYLLKVRGIDDLGLAGQNGVASFSIDTSLNPALAAPILNKPVIEERELTFTWQTVENTEHYQIELAADAEFKTILHAEKITENKFITNLSEEYSEAYFRIKSVSTFYEAGSFSEPQAVTIEEHGILYFFGTILLFMAL